MRTFIQFLFCTLIIFSHFNAPAAEVVKLDRIVAIVDQTVITEQELEGRIRTVTAQLAKQGTEPPPKKILRKQNLKTLNSLKLSNGHSALVPPDLS